MKPIEIFRPGTFQAMGGQSVSFSAADLAEAAAAYDPALHEAPLVVGHPTHDAPAYGWVKGLTFEGERLVAHPDQVEPAFAEIIAAGRFKKRSASFYAPTHPQNPKPGSYYLKHVGFLGATPPAVKGLKAVEFGDDADTVTVEFSEGLRRIGWSLRDLAELARRFREYVLLKDGQDEADKLVPGHLIDSLTSSASDVISENKTPSFAEPKETEVQTQAEIDTAKAELDRRDAELKAREEKLKATEVQFAEAEKKARRDTNARELDELIKAGKFVPALKAEALDFMDQLDTTTTIEFGEGNAKAAKTPSAWFLDLLKQSGKVVDFSERAAELDDGNGTVSFAAPDGAVIDPERLALHNKAVEYQRTHPNTSYVDAVNAVGGR